MNCPVCGMGPVSCQAVAKADAGQGGPVFYIAACGTCGARYDQRACFFDGEADRNTQARVNENYYRPAFSQEEYSDRLATGAVMIESFLRFARLRSIYVELGVGLGFLTRAAGAHFQQAYGLDLEIETAASAGPIPPNVHFILHDAFLKSHAHAISALAAWHVLEHFPDPRAVLRPFALSLEDEGVFFGQVPLFRSDYVFDAHYIFYDERALVALFAQFSLSPVYFERDERNHFLSFCFRKRLN